jgi:hypothetical protein
LYGEFASILAFDVRMVWLVLSSVVAVLWGLIEINNFINMFNYHYEDISCIKREEEDKKSFALELQDYKDSLEVLLTVDYKEYEKDLMASVKDSKLIAAVLQKGSYADVLQSHAKNIKSLQSSIYYCDRNIARYKSSIRVRKQVGFGFLLK